MNLLINKFRALCTFLYRESGSGIRVLKPNPEIFENRIRIRTWIQAKTPDPDSIMNQTLEKHSNIQRKDLITKERVEKEEKINSFD